MAEVPTFSFLAHDKPYRVDINNLTGTELRAFRLAVGVPCAAALQGIATGQVELLEAIAGFIWIVDRREKKELTYDAVLETLSYATVDVETEVEDDEPDPPQGRPSGSASPPLPTSMGSDLGKSMSSPSMSSTSI